MDWRWAEGVLKLGWRWAGGGSLVEASLTDALPGPHSDPFPNAFPDPLPNALPNLGTRATF